MLNDKSRINRSLNSFKRRLSRTKSETTIKSLLRRIEGSEGKLIQVNKKLLDIEKDIQRKNKELNKLKEQQIKKIEREEKKREKDLQREMNSIEKSLDEHCRLHYETQRKIMDLKNVPEKINIAFITASPRDQTHLSPDEEVREIEENIRKAEYRDSISFTTSWAARPLDLLLLINEKNPTIIHFSGHGSEEGQLAFQNDEGLTSLVDKKAIVQSIAASSDDVKLVFFSSCFTDQQARDIVKYIDAAIGMIHEISDDSARIFAAQFYSSIGFGNSVFTSFEQAKSALLLEGIPESHIPVLYTKEGLDSKKMFLVNPKTK